MMEDSDTPEDLKFDDVVTAIQCHPTEAIIASGLISGGIYLSKFSKEESNTELHKCKGHKKSCRALRFSEDGTRLYSVSKDKSLLCYDVHTGKLKRKIKGAHNASIYSMVITGESFVATGDDDGVLKIWDMRSKEATVELKECDDFISDMIVDDNKRLLIAASGEGTLTAFNIRRKRMDLQSELFDSEFLCLDKMKNGQKVVCGTAEGVLNVFNWGEWGNISDRFPCCDTEINCIAPVTQSVAVVGTDDGCLRAVNVLPNETIEVVGQHSEDFPVEALSITADRDCIVSCSHDECVKFWNIETLRTYVAESNKKGKRKGKKSKVFRNKKKDNFFAGLVDKDTANGSGEDGADSDDGSDSDSE